MGTQFPPPKRGHSPPPKFFFFGPCLLWPNGWMDHDATWYGGRPRPRRYCVRWGPSSPLPKKGEHALQFSACVYCGQMAGSIKVARVTEVGLSPGHIVLHGDPAPPQKDAQPPNFWPMSVVVRQSPISTTTEHLCYV